jgi:ADP-ribosylglycohydrolase
MTTAADRSRLTRAWQGRVTGCMLGKPVEILSMREGHGALTAYLDDAGAPTLRDYVPLVPGSSVESLFPECCRGRIDRAIPDDDINYTVLSLLVLEEYGPDFTTADIGRAWLRWLPGGMTFTAEREAYVRLLEKAGTGFTFGAAPAFDIAECSDNAFNDWIGAQIRADLYGWVLPGEPEAAAELAARDAELSHRGDGVHGAQAVAAMGAALAATPDVVAAVETAMGLLPADSRCVEAMALGLATAHDGADAGAIHAAYDGMSPVHTVNNLALVIWGLVRGAEDFSIAIGDTVAAGWDTDCNGATVGALWGLTDRPIPDHWTAPWAGRVLTSLAGVGELTVDDLVDRTLAVMA